MDPFFFSILMPVASVFVFDKNVECFRNEEFFIRGVFIFMCD